MTRMPTPAATPLTRPTSSSAVGQGVSGHLERCLPFAEYRDGAYRVRAPLLDQWGGGLEAQNGFVVRAPWLISVGDPQRFLGWFHSHEPTLVNRNN